jgi:hypothetical protein
MYIYKSLLEIHSYPNGEKKGKKEKISPIDGLRSFLQHSFGARRKLYFKCEN